MARIRVEYNQYNRAFKLLDEEIGSLLKDGVQYELIVPLVLGGDDSEEDDFLFTEAGPIAHA